MRRTDSARRTGPARSGRTSQAITDAVLHELAGGGYGRLSMDGVARRAAVGKAAIYRRWPSKEEMVLSIVADLGTRPELFPDTGTIEGDLRAFMHIASKHLSHPLVARIVPDLLAEAARDSALGAALHQRLGVVRRERGVAMLRRAIDRGELSENLDLALAADVIAAPVYWRLAVTREHFDEEDLERLVGLTLAALESA